MAKTKQKAKSVKKGATKKPTAKKPIVKKAIAKKPTAKKLIAKKPIAKKPAAKEQIIKKQESKTITLKKTTEKMDTASANKSTVVNTIYGDSVIEQKLKALFDLQTIDSEIDKIRTQRGELPLEIQDLEDEIAGLDTRVKNYNEEMSQIQTEIASKKNIIADAKGLMKKYIEQQKNVRNNREFESLAKEIEFQGLEGQLAEKRIREFKSHIEEKELLIEESQKKLTERKTDLQHKKKELTDIVKATEEKEHRLTKRSGDAAKIIEERLLTAYKRIRQSARNGLAVVVVERDACGGCFNKVPPQRQLDIRTHKKIIVCEHCGRILVDVAISNISEN